MYVAGECWFSYTVPSAAIADSARPTDFRSEVLAVDPPTPSIEVSIVGGDAFVLLRVDPGGVPHDQ